MNFLEKLDLLMEKNDMNKNSLSKQSGIPYTTIDGFYKKGYQNAKLPTIQKIAKFFDVTLDYLMLDDVTDINYGKTDGFMVETEEMYLIKDFRLLSISGKELLKENLKSLMKYEQQLKVDNSPPDTVNDPPADYGDKNVLFINTYTQTASAGTGQYLDDETAQKLGYPADRVPDGTDFAVPVSGDSMEPLYYDGDIIFVRRKNYLNIGDVGLFTVNGEGLVKEYGKDGLISLNEKYPVKKPKEADDFRIVGEVLGKLLEIHEI